MLAVVLLAAANAATPPGEVPVAPYSISDANAGARPLAGTSALAAFHGKAGLDRMTDVFVDRLLVDPRISDIFKGQDIVRLRRLLKEQFCYLLNGGCDYTGRDMKTGHKNLGLQNADFNALVEDLQLSMNREGVPFAAQNRLLARLAPMRRDVVER